MKTTEVNHCSNVFCLSRRAGEFNFSSNRYTPSRVTGMKVQGDSFPMVQQLFPFMAEWYLYAPLI
jgi:hypothetical protein